MQIAPESRVSGLSGALPYRARRWGSVGAASQGLHLFLEPELLSLELL
jgi:hypothetical protein